MAQHYTRYLQILKKWPVEEARTTNCFGKYLRDSSSKWFTPDGRVVGNPDVCNERLKSLERLLADHHREKYPAHVKTVTEMSLSQCTEALMNEFTDNETPMKKILSKITGKSN